MNPTLRRLLLTLTTFAAVAYGGLAAAAVHAPANTAIANTATLNYQVSGSPQPPINSNTVTVTVDELVDVDVTRQSANPLAAFSPATDQPIRFTVTNLGNGSEQYNLTGNLVVGGDQFDPTGLEFFVDDGDNLFEPNAGDGAAVTSITLAGEAVGTVWFVADIPGGRTDGDLGNVTLTATAATGTGAPGTQVAGQGTGGVDAVFGTSGGDDLDAAGYLISNIAFTVTKTAVLLDPFGGTQAVPGTVITYTMTVTTTGSGSATGVVLQDDVPANTTYVAGSTNLNGGAVETDAADADACDFNVTNLGGIHCAIGTLTGATTTTVVFQVTIN